MTEHHGTAHAKLIKRLREQRRLRFSRPDARPGALAVAKPRPVEANDTIVSGQAVDQTTQDEILNHGAIPVEQDHAKRGRIAAFYIVKAHSAAFHEGADWWVPSLRDYLKRDIGDDQNHKSGRNDQQNSFRCGHR